MSKENVIIEDVYMGGAIIMGLPDRLGLYNSLFYDFPMTVHFKREEMGTYKDIEGNAVIVVGSIEKCEYSHPKYQASYTVTCSIQITGEEDPSIAEILQLSCSVEQEHPSKKIVGIRFRYSYHDEKVQYGDRPALILS